MSKILLVLLTSIFVTGCSLDLKSDKPIENGMIQENVQLNDIPEFSNEPYTVLNGMCLCLRMKKLQVQKHLKNIPI